MLINFDRFIAFPEHVCVARLVSSTHLLDITDINQARLSCVPQSSDWHSQ